MDVSLSDEQQAWLAASTRLAEAHATTGPDHISADGWGDALALGIPGLRSPAHAGVEATGVESALSVEAAGRQLCALPIVGQGVLVPELLEAAGAHDAMDAVLSGDLRLAPALLGDLSDFAGLGSAAVAFDAAGATHALVLDPNGDDVRLAAVALLRGPASPGAGGLDLTRDLRRIPAGTMASTFPTGLGDAFPVSRVARARNLARTALAADLLGVMEGALADAVQYAKDRQQFGTPIGTFQALQHLLADAHAQVEGVRGCVWYAAWAGDHADEHEATLASRAAKACASEIGRQVAETCVQVFGGLAITWEHVSHLRLRRVLLDRVCFGDETAQYRAIAWHRIRAGATP